MPKGVYQRAPEHSVSIGQRFSRLIVLEPAGVNRWRKLLWRVRCDCGQESVVEGKRLRSRAVRSCGCQVTRFGEGDANPRWVGEKASDQCGRQRARKLFPGTHVCEIDGCGRKAERHHKDDNTANNDPGNIAFLCHKHHVEADGRMVRPALRAALRAAVLGVPHTPEHRAKISEGLRGRPCSDETRTKIAARITAHYAAKGKPAHCPHGHAYDEANTSVRKAGTWDCRACARARALRLYHELKAQAQ